MEIKTTLIKAGLILVGIAIGKQIAILAKKQGIPIFV
jgi:hypothetical protein